jgi:hypothetical protein
MPDPATITSEGLLTLATETWRAQRELERMRDQQTAIGLRYSLRKVRGVLEELGISYLDLTGQRYDAGMSVDIIDVEGEGGDAADLVVKEMMAPIILWNGALLAWGEAVLERRTARESIKR